MQRASIGVVSAPVDSEGILRRFPLMFSVYGPATLGFALALMHAGTDSPAVQVDGGELQVGSSRWPINASGEVSLRYPSGLSGLRTVLFYHAALAASSVAGLEPLAASFNDKIILIGSSSAALCDFVETPLGRVPGVKAQALMTQLVLNGHVLKPPQ